MTTTRLNQDFDMVERMELDLIAKATSAFTAADVAAGVFGVFSLDDLEHKTEAELCQKIALGVGYTGAEPRDNAKAALGTAPGGSAVKVIDFMFAVILAVPHGDYCQERYSATKLMTVLRRGILGSSVSGDSTNRTWSFVKEFPNISNSTDTMLYYTQVWRVDLPVTSA